MRTISVPAWASAVTGKTAWPNMAASAKLSPALMKVTTPWSPSGVKAKRWTVPLSTA